ncbi:hypothetical protein GCM10007939_24210 [Amylibacter marinus]|uniref:DNA gyrase inhibitor YacG n=1 Tax=Amylibacter marinus TaxID=1475483 RepID=A0ABQ5VY48_9RHOB|nr:DNA gyrase inhibitor YacG [Amylibacter marinus]GLQ36137.1 hypothetical protein GCM10007939_24210 [Amylibacter marinus]
MSCPICSKSTDEKYRPFCSKRCADIDLGKWLTGGYVIETDDISEDDSLPEQPQGTGPH